MKTTVGTLCLSKCIESSFIGRKIQKSASLLKIQKRFRPFCLSLLMQAKKNELREKDILKKLVSKHKEKFLGRFNSHKAFP